MYVCMYSPFPGNNWGRDSEGEGLGHGPQEEFYGCADVAVTDDDKDSTVSVTSTSAPTTNSTAALTDTHSTLTSNPTATSAPTTAPISAPNTEPTSNATAASAPTTAPSPEMTSAQGSSSSGCHPTAAYAGEFS